MVKRGGVPCNTLSWFLVELSVLADIVSSRTGYRDQCLSQILTSVCNGDFQGRFYTVKLKPQSVYEFFKVLLSIYVTNDFFTIVDVYFHDC